MKYYLVIFLSGSSLTFVLFFLNFCKVCIWLLFETSSTWILDERSYLAQDSTGIFILPLCFELKCQKRPPAKIFVKKDPLRVAAPPGQAPRLGQAPAAVAVAGT
jgi:hypothetical protein